MAGAVARVVKLSFGLSDGQQAAKVQAIADLRAALLAWTDLPAALRSCCYRNPVYFALLFCGFMDQRFRRDADIREITAFVARIRRWRSSAGQEFPSREAEALIRLGLGDPAMAGLVDPYVFSYLEIELTVLGCLFTEWRPDPDQLAASFARADELLAERANLPQIAEAESRWFAAGFSQSPFANFEAPGGAPEMEGGWPG